MGGNQNQNSALIDCSRCYCRSGPGPRASFVARALIIALTQVQDSVRNTIRFKLETIDSFILTCKLRNHYVFLVDPVACAYVEPKEIRGRRSVDLVTLLRSKL